MVTRDSASCSRFRSGPILCRALMALSFTAVGALVAPAAFADSESYNQNHSSTFRWRIYFTPCPVPNKTFASLYAKFNTKQAGEATRGGRDTTNNSNPWCQFISGRQDAVPFDYTNTASVCLTRDRPTWTNPPLWNCNNTYTPPPAWGPGSGVATCYEPGLLGVRFNCAFEPIMASPDDAASNVFDSFDDALSLSSHAHASVEPSMTLEDPAICQTSGSPSASYENYNYSIFANNVSGSNYESPLLGEVQCTPPYCFDCEGSDSGYSVDHASGSISADEHFRIALPANSWGQPRNLCLKLDASVRAAVDSIQRWKHFFHRINICPIGPGCVKTTCIGTPAKMTMKTGVTITVKVYAASARDCALPTGTPFFSRTYSGSIYSGADFAFADGIFANLNCNPCGTWIQGFADCDANPGTPAESSHRSFSGVYDSAFHEELGFTNNTPLIIVIDRHIETSAGE